MIEGHIARYNSRLNSLEFNLSLSELKDLISKLEHKKLPLKIRHLAINIQKARVVSKVGNALSEGGDSEEDNINIEDEEVGLADWAW